jgi:hypothetical protein
MSSYKGKDEVFDGVQSVFLNQVSQVRILPGALGLLQNANIFGFMRTLEGS